MMAQTGIKVQTCFRPLCPINSEDIHSPKIDILGEQKYIYLHETGDWKLGTSVEVGYRPIKDLRLGLGYTFTEYDDGSQAHNDQDYLARGPYFKITLTPSF